VRRREFVTLVGAAATWPLAALAQEAGRVYRIGVLSGLAQDDPQSRAELTALREVSQGWGGSLAVICRARIVLPLATSDVFGTSPKKSWGGCPT